MDSERLAELRALAESATPGPWEPTPDDMLSEGLGVVTFHPDGMGGPVCEMSDPYPRGINHPVENMRFIAACNPLVVLELLYAIDRVRALHHRVPDGHGGFCHECQGAHEYWPCPTIAALGDSE